MYLVAMSSEDALNMHLLAELRSERALSLLADIQYMYWTKSDAKCWGQNTVWKNKRAVTKTKLYLSFANRKSHKIGAFFRGLHGLNLMELGIPADTALMAEYAKLTGLSGKKQ